MKRNKIFAILFGIACCNSFVLSQVVEYDNGDGVPRTIKEFAPNASEVCQIDSDTTFEVRGFLYITKKLCGIESNIANLFHCMFLILFKRKNLIYDSNDRQGFIHRFSKLPMNLALMVWVCFCEPINIPNSSAYTNT